ncbi:putative Farnesyl pyrophosphate synthase [Blattamonas nauphoetae]|uniref:Farnesyl pyrophosphate synthase n=1 Tax=Blattamonas nauphoetae TaxID=2049346 RepID=A0ABQ9XHC0_9EUKA|nr:putative Farnesyl pyrophosphate synthase [Blattamonas nauphoetae]
MIDQKYLTLMEDARKEAIQFVQSYPDCVRTGTSQHLASVLEYNLGGGKMQRGATTVLIAEKVSKSLGLPFDEKQAAIAGICTEIIHTSFLIADDIEDHAITRRGQDCWYRLPGIGLNAINDASLTEHIAIELLRSRFSTHPHLLNLVHVFQSTLFRTGLGQHLDNSSCYSPNHDLFKQDTLPLHEAQLNFIHKHHTPENYRNITNFKTSFYTYWFPINVGLIVGGLIPNDEEAKLIESLCLNYGHLFQAKDDMLDCYADPKVIGKIGTDIEDGKCSWLVSTALSETNTELKAKIESTIQKHYGINNPEDVAVIKALYNEIGIPAKWDEYESKLMKEIQEQIHLLGEKAPKIPQDVLDLLLSITSKRSK